MRFSTQMEFFIQVELVRPIRQPERPISDGIGRRKNARKYPLLAVIRNWKRRRKRYTVYNENVFPVQKYTGIKRNNNTLHGVCIRG